MSIIHHHFWLNNKESADFFTLQSGDRILLQDDQSFMESNEDLVVDPLTFGSPMVWLDASDASTISDTANSVDQWTNKAINSQPYESTGTNRPLTNTTTLNGLNTIQFDGTNDYLELIAKNKIVNDANIITGDFTTVMVGRRGADGVFEGLYCHEANASSGGGLAGTFIGFTGTNVPRKFQGADRNAITPITSTQAFNVTGRGLSGSHRVSNVEENTGAHSSPSVGRASRTVVGAGVTGVPGVFAQYFNGEIAEIIIYNQRLTDSDIDSLYNDYLLPKWGV